MLKLSIKMPKFEIMGAGIIGVYKKVRVSL